MVTTTPSEDRYSARSEDGRAKPVFTLGEAASPKGLALMMQLFMPMTCPQALINGPPLLP